MTSQPHAFDRTVLGHVIDAAPDGVVLVNREGVVLYWNSGAERIFGFTATEMLGSSLDPIIPDRFQERHWRAFTHAVDTGESRYGPDDLLAVPARRSDGQTISIEFTVVLLAGDEDIQHVAALVRDVTERRAKELELRRRLAELEAAGQQ
jgi:PAS domain S-box-containing protein